MTRKKILVIGANGFTGRRILDDLSRNLSYQTTGCSLHDDICPHSGNYRFIRTDICNRQAVEKLFQEVQPDVVINTSALSVPDYCETHHAEADAVNITAVEHLAECCEAGGSRFIHLSTDFVFGGDTDRPYTEEDIPAPVNYYGYTKVAIEENMRWYARLGKLNYAALRYFNAVGYAADKSITGKERNPQNLMPIIMEAATGRREKFSIFGNDYDTPDGTCIRDYVHVSDLARAHTLALKKLMCGGASFAVNLGTGKGTSVKEIVDAAEKVIGRKLNYDYAPRRAGDPAVLTAKADRAGEILGWVPEYTDIEEIIRTVWNLEI